jgi:glutathione S-transferase
MFKILYEPNSFSTPPTQDQFNKWKDDFLSCLKILDLRLVDNTWLCGARMTIGDIIVYNDLSMFMNLCDYTPSSSEMSEHTNLMKWCKKMGKDQEIASLDTKFAETLKK